MGGSLHCDREMFVTESEPCQPVRWKRNGSATPCPE